MSGNHQAPSHSEKQWNMGYLPHTYYNVKGGWVGWEKRTVQQQRTCGMIWHLKPSCKSRCPSTNPPAIDPLLTEGDCRPAVLFTFSLQYRSKVSWQSWLKTRFLILEIFEARIFSFDFRGSRIGFWGSSSSFKTLEEFSRSQTEILRKRFNSRKQNNSNEHNNWRMALFVGNSL